MGKKKKDILLGDATPWDIAMAQGAKACIKRDMKGDRMLNHTYTGRETVTRKEAAAECKRAHSRKGMFNDGQTPRIRKRVSTNVDKCEGRVLRVARFEHHVNVVYKGFRP